MKIRASKLLITLLSFLIYLLLDYGYSNTIEANYYEFEKLDFGTPSPYKLAISIMIPITLTGLLLFLRSSELIYSVLNFVLILSIYPASILLRELNADTRIIILQSIYFLSIYSIGNHLWFRFKAPIIKESQKTTTLIVLCALMILPFIWIFGPHVDYSNLLLINIYESREIETQQSNLYTGYTYSVLSNVLIPLLLLLSLYYREYAKTFLACCMLLFMFLVGAHKSVFIGTFLLIFFYYGNYYEKIQLCFSGIIILLVISIVSYELFDSLHGTSLITRRVFFLPAILEIGYFDLFDSDSLFWSDSILRNFIEYPYETPPKNLIGQHVLSNINTNANNGIISDGFMNFGVTGALLNIFIVSLIYSILNSLQISHRYFGLIILMLLTFYSSYLFTSLLTHGVLFFILISYFFLRDTSKHETL